MAKEKGRTGRNKGRIRNRCPSHARAVAAHWTEQHKYVRVYRSSGAAAAHDYEGLLFKKGIYIPDRVINHEKTRYEARPARKASRAAKPKE